MKCIKSLMKIFFYNIQDVKIKESFVWDYNSVFFSLPERSYPFNSEVACLLMYLMKSSNSRPPSYLTGESCLFFGSQNNVGKPRTSKPGGTSLAVASIFTIDTSSSFNLSPSSSKIGANLDMEMKFKLSSQNLCCVTYFLQCPHHGA